MMRYQKDITVTLILSNQTLRVNRDLQDIFVNSDQICQRVYQFYTYCSKEFKS